MSKIKLIVFILFFDLKYYSVCWYILVKEGGGGLYFLMNNRIYLCFDLKKRNINMF